MPITFDGKEIETTANGYLVDIADWSEGLATQMAADDDIELYIQRSWLIPFATAGCHLKTSTANKIPTMATKIPTTA